MSKNGEGRFVIRRGVGDELRQTPQAAAVLRKEAERVRDRVRAPSGLTLSTRAGVSRRGAFAQVIMRGAGALYAEFGTRRRPALAPLRSALRGGR